MTDVTWRPTQDYIDTANVTRLMRAHGVADIGDLRRRSVEDIDWYWDAVVKDLGIPFDHPYSAVHDSSRGIEWTRWFIDGRINVTSACVDRWRHDRERAGAAAIIHETEPGTVTTITYGQLADSVDATATALQRAGIGKGDAVGVFLPMCPEAVIAAYAVARLGAVYLPLFSGFAGAALASRLQDADVRLVITANATWRRGRTTPMKPVLDEALLTCPSVRTVLVHRGPELTVHMREGRDVDWADFLGPPTAPAEKEMTEAEDVLLLGYTSGTTGKPKGAVHTHAGFLVKVASEVAYELDLHPGQVLFWVTDMGWVMGPLSMIGAHAVGGTMLMYEGAPDYPDAGRIWDLCSRHRVCVLGVSPTLIRSMRPYGADLARAHDLTSIRIIGSTGEPWNPAPYQWLAQDVMDGRVPIINISGGTEVGGAFLAPYPVEPIKPCSLGGPSLGMDVDVLDPDGRSLRGEVGELVCRQPWPAMTRGVFGSPERYLESYWSMYPGIWRHGDWAKIDEDGQWFLFGRSDEAINVAGKRLGPAEVESILAGHPAVAESATVGIPDETKGEAVWCFWTPVDPGGDDVSEELAERVAHELGRPFKPARVVRVAQLPRTRSAKILRRAVRAVAIGADPGDLSSAENPEALDEIRTLLQGGSRPDGEAHGTGPHRGSGRDA